MIYDITNAFDAKVVDAELCSLITRVVEIDTEKATVRTLKHPQEIVNGELVTEVTQFYSIVPVLGGTRKDLFLCFPRGMLAMEVREMRQE